jgi:DNA-binding transcriptional LysR family regulator
MADPAGEPSRQAVDRLLAGFGGAGPVPWEFEGLGTILSLVARGIGIAALPRLTLGIQRAPAVGRGHHGGGGACRGSATVRPPAGRAGRPPAWRSGLGGRHPAAGPGRTSCWPVPA